MLGHHSLIFFFFFFLSFRIGGFSGLREKERERETERKRKKDCALDLGSYNIRYVPTRRFVGDGKAEEEGRRVMAGPRADFLVLC